MIEQLVSMTPDQLAQAWLDAKADEEAAKALRVGIEGLLSEHLEAPEEGSKTHNLPSGLKVILTNSLSYKTEMAVLGPLLEELPEGMRPVKTKVELDSTGCKYLRSKRPELWAKIAPAITVKPAKTAVKVSF